MKIIQDIGAHRTEISECVKDGNPIAVPTDTNYNLACDPESIEAINKIYLYKQRKRDKPLSLFFLNRTDWEKYGVPENRSLMQILTEHFWPGPLNIVLNRKSDKYDYLLNGSSTISLGCIKNKTWRTFMELMDCDAVALTSANISGCCDERLVTKETVIQQMSEQIPYLIEDLEENHATSSSTIVLLERNGIKVLREGDITLNILKGVLEKEGYYVKRN